jgi:acetyl-CoA carboxylase biotin carboxylase subunit
VKIRRLLIANRGEIALRIIRTCRTLGIETVLAASSVDRNALPARLADRTVCIGPGHPGESYLRAETIVQAAVSAGADAIHPGYGFLSERASLPKLCEEVGIVFVGPTAAQLEAVGDKLTARGHAEAAKVPVVPGGAVGDASSARRLVRKIGFPLLVKSVGGGGGRGMKRVDHPSDLDSLLALAGAEAEAAFGDARLYIERCIEHGRHVEVQLLGDGDTVVQLGDRDCSVQRRYQKLIEETPAPSLPADLRHAIHDAAVRYGERLSYRSAGTVEFLVDLLRGSFHFLEMNARIQVEHPVTEAATGIDLIAEQIAIAEGAPLRFRQSDIRPSGHAIECRINAEDPEADFRPSPGTVTLAEWPGGEGIRVDSHIVAGSAVPPFYDSLLGKIIAHGPDRATAIARLGHALASTRIEGVKTNLAFHRTVLADPAFVRGGVDTGFVARRVAKEAA